jgi:hypothetical protein
MRGSGWVFWAPGGDSCYPLPFFVTAESKGLREEGIRVQRTATDVLKLAAPHPMCFSEFVENKGLISLGACEDEKESVCN